MSRMYGVSVWDSVAKRASFLGEDQINGSIRRFDTRADAEQAAAPYWHGERFRNPKVVPLGAAKVAYTAIKVQVGDRCLVIPIKTDLDVQRAFWHADGAARNGERVEILACQGGQWSTYMVLEPAEPDFRVAGLRGPRAKQMAMF